jgi:hypothetical protein
MLVSDWLISKKSSLFEIGQSEIRIAYGGHVF